MNLLNNKYSLYLALMSSLVYVYLLITKQHFNSVVFFVILGVLTSYFSKNMAVILLVPLVLTYVLSSANVIKEGMKNGNNKKDKNDKKDKVDELMNNAKHQEAMTKNLNSAMSEQESQEALSAIEKMAKQQESMMNNIEKMGPMIQQAQNMMEKMGGLEKMENMIGGLSNMMGQLGGKK